MLAGARGRLLCRVEGVGPDKSLVPIDSIEGRLIIFGILQPNHVLPFARQ